MAISEIIPSISPLDYSKLVHQARNAWDEYVHLLDAYIQYYGAKDGTTYFSSKKISSITLKDEYLDMDAYPYGVFQDDIHEYIDDERNRRDCLVPALDSYYTGKMNLMMMLLDGLAYPSIGWV